MVALRHWWTGELTNSTCRTRNTLSLIPLSSRVVELVTLPVALAMVRYVHKLYLSAVALAMVRYVHKLYLSAVALAMVRYVHKLYLSAVAQVQK